MLSHHKKTLENCLSSVFSFFVMLAEVSANLFPSGNVFAEGSASMFPSRNAFAEVSASLFPSGNAFAEGSASMFPSGNAFAESSASRSRAESHLRNLPQTYHFFDFWLAHHVFIDVLKRALHASDCHALYPIYTIDADNFIRL